MRIWSLHPKLLDAKGLVALWREGLLAQAVLRGRTRGYTHHPQLARFRGHPKPIAAIGSYLHVVCDEAKSRGYNFDRSRLGRRAVVSRIPVTEGQLRHELGHLRKKLSIREPLGLLRLDGLSLPECHPLFSVVKGGIESWERTGAVSNSRKNP